MSTGAQSDRHPGSLCLNQPDRQILFIGDAPFAAQPITGKRELGLYMRLNQPDRQILFIGDAPFAAHPITGKRELGLYVRHFAMDTAQARESAKKPGPLPVDVLCCRHSAPIMGAEGEQIKALPTTPCGLSISGCRARGLAPSTLPALGGDGFQLS